MTSFTILVALLLTLTAAKDPPGTYTTYYRSLQTDAPKRLHVDAIVKTFDCPPLNLSAVTNNHSDGLDGEKAPVKIPASAQDFVPTIRDCLDPLDRPILEDCEAVCENLSEQQGPLLIQPLTIWYIEAGHCIFGAANLDPCADVNIDPIGSMAGFCNSMLASCVRSGYDGYIEGAPPPMAFAISGTEAAPPYHEGPCQ